MRFLPRLLPAAALLFAAGVGAHAVRAQGEGTGAAKVKFEPAGACRGFARKRVEWGIQPRLMTLDQRNRHLTSDFADHPSAILDLLEAGAHVNAMDDAGFTALTHAARSGQSCAVKILLDNGADPNVIAEVEAQDKTKTSALALARRGLEREQALALKGQKRVEQIKRFQDVIDLLIAAGAAEPAP